MSLAASLNKFKTEYSDATSRNLQSSRPSSNTPRTSTPKPGEGSKRTHDSAFSQPAAAPTVGVRTGIGGTEIFTHVFNAVQYLKEKSPQTVDFEHIISYLSLPNDAQRRIPQIKNGLKGHPSAEWLEKSNPKSGGRECFKYRPTHPVTNAEELKDYLATLKDKQGAQGLPVKELKDGWPDCMSELDKLEKEGFVLIIRNKKEMTPKYVYPDSPSYHILNQNTQKPMRVDADFADVWAKTKLPASDIEMRNDLEKAGLTPTSLVKEVKKVEPKRKEKRRINRKGGKTTNSHMLGILKDYSKK